MGGERAGRGKPVLLRPSLPHGRILNDGAPHLLVVEDSADVRRAMRIIFEAAGYRVSEAGTLAEARLATGGALPDAILLDLTLPDGDGLDLIPGLQPRTQEKPVIIALTGRDEPEVTQRCRSSGCHEVLLKPVPPRELVRTVGALLA